MVNMAEMEIESYLFETPTTISISGSTSSGKTSFVKKLIQNKDIVFKHPPHRVIYCYGVYQEAFRDMKNVEFFEGLPEGIDKNSDGKHILIILDDLMDVVVKDERIQCLFTRGSHHKNITVIYINQNMVMQGRCARSISLNTHYLLLFRNPRDVHQVSTLGKQLGMHSKLVEAYKDAVNVPYGYLLVDLSPHNHSQFKLKTHVLPGEEQVVYL